MDAPSCLDSRSVSRLHALIQRKDTGDLALVDLGSRNGSFVNGKRVSFPVALNDKDRLLFGDQELTFAQSLASASVLTVTGGDTRNEPTTALHTHTLTSIMVVDIRDFTPLARTLSESLLSQTIGTWFLRAGQITQREGSWAQKYIGDAVMAVWVHDQAPISRATSPRSPRHRRYRRRHRRDQQCAAAARAAAHRRRGRHRAGDRRRRGLHRARGYRKRGLPLETATKSLGLGVALGERTYAELTLEREPASYSVRSNSKGYDGPAPRGRFRSKACRTCSGSRRAREVWPLACSVTSAHEALRSRRWGAFFWGLGGPGLLLLGILDSSFLFAPLGNDLLVVAMTARARSVPPMLYYAFMSTVGSVIGCLLVDVVFRRAGEKGPGTASSEEAPGVREAQGREECRLGAGSWRPWPRRRSRSRRSSWPPRLCNIPGAGCCCVGRGAHVPLHRARECWRCCLASESSMGENPVLQGLPDRPDGPLHRG